MRSHALVLAVAATAILSVSACTKNNNGGGNGPANVQSPQAEKAAGNKTIAQGLVANSQFMAAAKAAGLDQTLAGPGPYTVFVATDQAIAKRPPERLTRSPGIAPS